MSNRGRGRGRGFGRGKYNEFRQNESSYGFGWRGRGRGSFSSYENTLNQSDKLQNKIERHPPDTSQEIEEKQPIFTPQPQLDYHSTNFLTNLRSVWSLWKKSENVSRMLQEYFLSVENPYDSAFKVAVTCPDFYQGKPMSLPLAVIEELAVFLKPNKEKYASCLTLDIKFDVFDIFTKQRNGLLTKMAFEVYELQSSKEMFVERINSFIQNRQYKEACQTAMYLGLDQFGIEDFVVPLLFQDKLTIAEDYLRISPAAQTATAQYLDQLLQGRVNEKIMDVIRQLNIPEPKQEKLQYKPMSKLLARFLKIFNIHPSSCPNLTRKKREGALHFVICKRYKYNEIEGECWREMVSEAVCGDSYLEEELVAAINLHGDVVEAAFFARKFNIPAHKLPYNVVTYLRTGTLEYHYSPPRVTVPRKVLQLPESHIVMMVDTDESLARCVEAVSNTHVVGLDAEWKPAFCSETEALSLLQVATHEETFLVDVPALQHSPVWKDLSQGLFLNPDILKLGFGLSVDLLKLKESINMNDVKMAGLGFLDLNLLWKKLMREFNITLPFKGEESDTVEGLSKLVSLCVGLPLDKSEQFSNWDRRPLRDAQRNYAALDAYCLIIVYEVLAHECINQGVPFQDVCQDLMIAGANVTKKPKKKPLPSRKVFEEPTTQSSKNRPIRVADFKVVCDTMLQGLGRSLRSVGVDAEILSNTQNHNVCVALNREQNRVILTKGAVYDRLHTQVPEGMCYRVMKQTSKEQMVEVLRFYNVMVAKEDIFSRCQLCNGADFKKLTPQELRKAIDSTYRTHRHVSAHQLDIADDDYDDYNDFDDDSCSDDDIPGPVTHAPSGYVTSQAGANHTPVEEDTFYGYNCETSTGAHIKHESIPKDKFDSVPLFYVCDNCGHCYWDGSHLVRILDNLQHIVAK
ncbi:exonuclease mut-7 homolog isoform X2 [Macrosteles quadrilineatus]|uniref:exonuclease mut-7 homolog isoform X2 n=1 Tax=Macrosteles quadrilineatus TaxID=74068 RepID=UPI0023E30FA7|nr:exonuclease mut-7 homolog isoform X2 [Macrosteles quadrilineatus]